MPHSSTITKAIAPSTRFDHRGANGAPIYVGHDIYTITGHVTVGNEVYLTLSPPGWVRSLDILKENQCPHNPPPA